MTSIYALSVLIVLFLFTIWNCAVSLRSGRRHNSFLSGRIWSRHVAILSICSAIYQLKYFAVSPPRGSITVLFDMSSFSEFRLSDVFSVFRVLRFYFPTYIFFEVYCKLECRVIVDVWIEQRWKYELFRIDADMGIHLLRCFWRSRNSDPNRVLFSKCLEDVDADKFAKIVGILP